MNLVDRFCLPNAFFGLKLQIKMDAGMGRVAKINSHNPVIALLHDKVNSIIPPKQVPGVSSSEQSRQEIRVLFEWRGAKFPESIFLARAALQFYRDRVPGMKIAREKVYAMEFMLTDKS